MWQDFWKPVSDLRLWKRSLRLGARPWPYQSYGKSMKIGPAPGKVKSDKAIDSIWEPHSFGSLFRSYGLIWSPNQTCLFMSRNPLSRNLCRSQCFEAACKVRLLEAAKGTRELTLPNHESKGCRCASGAPWIDSAFIQGSRVCRLWMCWLMTCIKYHQMVNPCSNTNQSLNKIE